jgi:sugar phosphate isomerase/epimerase
MKFGLKLFPHNLFLIPKFKDLFDFFELYVHPEIDLKLLLNIDKVITIHCAHMAHGFNPSDPNKESLNTNLLKKAKRAADITGSPWIIIHPGLNHGVGSIDNMIHFLKKNWDSRIILENLISFDYSNERYLCCTPEEIRSTINLLDLRMILDFGHAICTANIFGKDPYDFIGQFMKLNPITFHLSGIDICSKQDMHCNIYPMNNDYRFVSDIPLDSFVTFETGVKNLSDYERHKKDIEFVKSLIIEEKKLVNLKEITLKNELSKSLNTLKK